MRFDLEQRFRAPVARVEALFLDPELLDRLGELPGLGKPQLLGVDDEGETVRQRVRYRFTGRLSGAVTAVVDPAKLTWVQESLIDRHNFVADFEILPDHYPDRLRCAGTISYHEVSGGGCSRLTEGDLVVRFPLVAARVERAIIDGLRSYAKAEAKIVEEWLEAR